MDRGGWSFCVGLVGLGYMKQSILLKIFIVLVALAVIGGAVVWGVAQSTESLISNAWYPKTAAATLTGLELTNTTHYALGYIYSWQSSQWKCGCRDSACTQSYWQIQSFKR